MLGGCGRWVFFQSYEAPKIPNQHPGDESLWQGYAASHEALAILFLGAATVATGTYISGMRRGKHDKI